jgi:WD40 repeat protein
VWNLIASENAEPGELLYTPSHNNIVQNLTFNSNGTQLATASQDSTAKIWDMTTGEALITLSGHQRVVSDVYFAPDGKTVITADDGTVKIWDISTDGQSERFDRNVHDAAVKSLVVDSSGALIASSSDDTLAHLLDSDSGEIVQTFAGHQDWIFGLSLSSDGSRLATSSLDGTAKVWDTQSGLEIATIDVYKGFGINVFPGILDVAIHPQNKDIIVTARADGLVNIHNLANDELISRTVLGPSYSINNLVFNTDGSYLAAAGQGTNSDLIDTVMIWETTQYEPVVKIEIPTLGWDMDFSPDSQLLAVGMSFGLLQVYAVTTGELLFDLEGHTSAIWRLRFDQSGKRLITLSFDGTVKLWDMETGLEQFTLPLTGLPSSIDVSPDGHWLYVGTGDGHVAGFALALENLLLLANSRTTRSLTEAECQQYLHLDACPEEISNR